MNLSVQIGKLILQNPVTVASGTFGYGVAYARLIDLNQIDAVTAKGLWLDSVRGHPALRRGSLSLQSPCRPRGGC